MKEYLQKDRVAWANYTNKHLDTSMNKLKVTYLYQFKKQYPKEDWRAFFKVCAVKENRITTYYQGELNRTLEDLEGKLFKFTMKSINKIEGKEMTNHKAKFWIKSSLDLYNKYAQQVYGQIYYACQETYMATMNMYLEDNYGTPAPETDKMFLEI